MARIREEIALIQNVNPGSRALILPQVGRTWLDWHLELTNIDLAELTEIEVKLVSDRKTVTLWEFSDGVELDEMNKRYGRETEDGVLSFYMRRPEMENEAQSMATALGTGGLQSVRVEAKIDAAATGAGITAWGRKVANRGVDEGILPYITNHNEGGQATGKNHFDSIEKRDRIAAIHVLNGDVTDLMLKVDDATVYELNRARGEFDERVGGRVPYADTYGMCIDFATAGVLDEALIMQSKDYQAQQMRLTSTLGASADATSRILVEYLSTWASLAGSNTQRAA